MKKKLLDRYHSLFDSESSFPEWAVRKQSNQEDWVKPSIPFIGKEYANQPLRILIYASAEVLSDYYPESGNERPWMEDDFLAMDRHRVLFDASRNNDSFFPNVHIQPMNDGALPTAVLYLASKLMPIPDQDPRLFYESIAFGNYGKFTIETPFQEMLRITKIADGSKDNKNIDYAGDVAKFLPSHPYLQADIEILKPDIIIMPKTILNHQADFIHSINPNIKLLGIYQMNARNVNQHIAKPQIKSNHPPASRSQLPPSVVRWYDAIHANGLTGKTHKNFLYVFPYLDKVLDLSK